MSEIVFEEPVRPEQARRGGDHWAQKRAAMRDALLARPGEWAVLATYSTMLKAQGMKSTYRTRMPRVEFKDCEFMVGARDDGTFALYIRYVGGGS